MIAAHVMRQRSESVGVLRPPEVEHDLAAASTFEPLVGSCHTYLVELCGEPVGFVNFGEPPFWRIDFKI